MVSNIKNKKTRTYARNRIFSRRSYENVHESDGAYLLKMVLCIVLGTIWIKFAAPVTIGSFPLGGIPIGLLVGLILVSQFEKYQFNRKIMYALLVVVTILSYFIPAGIVL